MKKKLLNVGRFLLLTIVVAAGNMFAILQTNAEEGQFEWRWRGDFAAYLRDTTQDATPSSFEQFVFNLLPHIEVNEKTCIDGYIHLMRGVIAEYSGETDPTGVGAGRHVDYRSTGDWGLFDAYLTHKIKEDQLKFRAGLFMAPFGFYNQRYYIQALYVTARTPGLESVYKRIETYGKRPEHVGTLYQRISQGFWLTGEQDNLNYDLYITNGASQVGADDDDNNKALGGRLGILLPVKNLSRVHLMYSGYRDTFREPPVTGNNTFNSRQTHLISLEVEEKDFKLQTEYADSRRMGEKIKAGYILAQNTFNERITPYLMYQRWNPEKSALPKSSVNGTNGKFASIGVAYHLTPWVTLLKLQFEKASFDNPAQQDHTRWWIGVSSLF